jgi:hypothetical protein
MNGGAYITFIKKRDIGKNLKRITQEKENVFLGALGG